MSMKSSLKIKMPRKKIESSPKYCKYIEDFDDDLSSNGKFHQTFQNNKRKKKLLEPQC